MANTKREIGTRIRAVRQRLKLSQREFAALIGVSNTAISAYENGDTYPSLPALVKIAGHGRVSFDWLVAGLELRETDLQHEETRLIMAFRQLATEDRHMIIKMAEYAAMVAAMLK